MFIIKKKKDKKGIKPHRKPKSIINQVIGPNVQSLSVKLPKNKKYR